MAETEQVGGAGMQKAGQAGTGSAAAGEGAGDGFRDARSADGDVGGKAYMVDCFRSFSGGDVCWDALVCGAAGLAGVVQWARWKGRAAGLAGAGGGRNSV